MGEIIARPYQEGDLDLFEVRETHIEELDGAKHNFAEWGKKEELGTCLLDGKVLYLVRWYTVIEGVLEVWIMPSRYAKDHKFQFVRHVLWLLDKYAHEQKAKRIQTWGLEKMTIVRWLEYLGFILEGEMKYFMPDNTSAKIWAKYYFENM